MAIGNFSYGGSPFNPSGGGYTGQMSSSSGNMGLNAGLSAGNKDKGKYTDPKNWVSGYGGQTYEGFGKAGQRSVRDQVWSQAAGKILKGAEGADAALLEAYRDLYRSRLGGAAAGQRRYVDSMGAEAAGQGMSGDVVRRMVAGRAAQQAQMLSGYGGEMEGQYGMQRAGLLQNTGNALAGLQLDQMKWEQNYQTAKSANKRAGQMGMLGAVAGIAGAALGGPLGGMMGASMFGGGGSYMGGGASYGDPGGVAPGTGPSLYY